MIDYVEPRITFDPWLADELARLDGMPTPVPPVVLPPLASQPGAPQPGTPSAFGAYWREITYHGGVRITYRSQIGHPVFDVLRIILLVASTFGAIIVIFILSPLSWFASVIAVILVPVAAWWNIFRPIPITHCIEVHPDGLIVDGRFFSVDSFGEHWPGLQMQDDNPNRIIFCGIYGSRFVVFASCHRADRFDRTPELLSEDLDLAMDQLWGRRDVMFPANPLD